MNLRVMIGSGVALCGLLAVGCATTETETRRPRRVQVNDPTREGENGERADPNSIPPEKFVELDSFFRGKVSQLQFRCYSEASEKTQKKYHGNVTVSVVVQPGGKSSDTKVISSTLREEGGEPGTGKAIEECVVAEMAKWEWPDVPAAAPFTGSVNFKPAW